MDGHVLKKQSRSNEPIISTVFDFLIAGKRSPYIVQAPSLLFPAQTTNHTSMNY
jgi:hypothetical protein